MRRSVVQAHHLWACTYLFFFFNKWLVGGAFIFALIFARSWALQYWTFLSTKRQNLSTKELNWSKNIYWVICIFHTAATSSTRYKFPFCNECIMLLIAIWHLHTHQLILLEKVLNIQMLSPYWDWGICYKVNSGQCTVTRSV